MKNKLFIFAGFVAIFIVSAMLIKNQPNPISLQEVENLSHGIEKVFEHHAAKNQSGLQTKSQPPKASNASSESIMAVIYHRPKATWFIKARGQSTLINQRAQEFSQLFLEKLTFNKQGKPDFSHIPSEYRGESAQNMRIATFNLKGLEISVTQLSADQDVDANIARWRRQLALPEDAPQFVKYQDNNQTVLVRLDQQGSATTTAAPKAPEKEKLEDFLQLTLSDEWKKLESSQGMASASLLLTDAGNQYDVAVLRLPASVNLEMILGIWKQRMGLPADVSLTSSELTSSHQQSWKLTPMQNADQRILLAMHKGKTRYTFLRLSHTKKLPASAREKFLQLIKESKVTKP